MGHRKMPAYGEREHGGRYILDDYVFSRNHNKAERIRRWKRDLKKRARAHNRRVMYQAIRGEACRSPVHQQAVDFAELF